jgi:hypothetical protein
MRLTAERWGHIVARHPEIQSLLDALLETVARPDMIQQGSSGELLAIRYYARTPLTSKFLVVAYRETGTEDGFVLSAYLTNRPSRRPPLWTR